MPTPAALPTKDNKIDGLSRRCPNANPLPFRDVEGPRPPAPPKKQTMDSCTGSCQEHTTLNLIEEISSSDLLSDSAYESMDRGAFGFPIGKLDLYNVDASGEAVAVSVCAVPAKAVFAHR